MIVYLDMDGVVTDAHRDFSVALGRPDLIHNHSPGVFHLRDVLGISEEEFWSKINAGGSEFWANMTELPWARQLYDDLCRSADVVFLSKPSYDPNCVKGKLEWLQRFTGDRGFENYIFTSRKELLAGKRRYLIDDRSENCQAFADAGGIAFQFPAYWAGKGMVEIFKAVEEVVASMRALSYVL